MSVRTAVDVPNAPPPGGPYSHAIAYNQLVFVSGQRPVDRVSGEIPEGFTDQVELVLENLKNVLQAAGSDIQHVLKVSVFLSDISHFDAFNTVYKQYFSSPYPARTTVGCQLRGINVEVDCVAGLGPQQELTA